MAWRNIWRNPRRTVLTLAAIAFASLLLVFMLSFQFGSYETMINSAVKIHTGHLKIQAEGYFEKQGIRRVVSKPGRIGEYLSGLPAVDAVSYRANAFSLVSSRDRTYGALVVGIDPAKEKQLSTLEALIRQGEFLSEQDTDAALIGKLLAKNLHVGLGDELTVLGQGRDGSVAAAVFTVKGIYSSGQDAFDRSSIQVPLHYFQEIFAMEDSVHEVVITGHSLGDVSTIARSAEQFLETLSPENPLVALEWHALMPGLLQGIQLDLISGFIFYLVLIMVVAFSILNTFLMAIFERTHEFGVLMALGTTPGRLRRLVLLESSVLTLVGVMAGIVLGCLVTGYFQVHGIDFEGASELLEAYGISGRMYPRLSILSALLGPGIVLVITVLTALYPAYRIGKLKPVEAIARK